MFGSFFAGKGCTIPAPPPYLPHAATVGPTGAVATEIAPGKVALPRVEDGSRVTVNRVGNCFVLRATIS